ncbi:hypothetical protein AEAC466_04315 [Asticcacaulis sp. AC466]|uniref:hypothetical protein n=1 Tax=Asticcacaulis sp. AC466 TaxID=1282362 RepID=UPI0003C3FFE6|nr:hypothetical protein [Asticcacaulis sp. AC466]ESQ85395.1 hypothetical protein AEAC466_04315 [Asticcacaulis sp. AC466]
MQLSLREIVLGSLAAACIIILGAHLYGARSTIADLRREIDGPVTGYKVRLTTCQANEATFRVAIDQQNKSFMALKTDSATRLAAAEQQVSAAHAAARAERTKFDRIMAAPPQGKTLLERYEDVDRRLLETLP